MFGDPHQAATGIIPELLALEPEGEHEDAAADDEEQEQEEQATCDRQQGQAPLDSLQSTRDSFQAASKLTAYV